MGNKVGKHAEIIVLFNSRAIRSGDFHKQRNQEHVNLTRQRLTRQLSTS